MMLAEGHGLVVLSVHQKSKSGNVGAHGAMSRIGEQRRSEATALKGPVDRQAADAHRRQRGIAGQTFGFLRRKVYDRYAR